MPLPPGPPLADLSAAFDDDGHGMILLALAAFSTVWVTAVGAAVGSFLNVVVYRLPQGMSLVRPKSRCPGCGASIRPGDNVPVLGWLRLRGRCRSCGGPISARYPLVEAATATLFLGLAHFELFVGGANLPGGPPRPTGLSFVLWHLSPRLIALYVYHVTLLASLLCLSLIAWDGFRPPRRLLVLVTAAGLLAPMFLPLRPVGSGLLISGLSAVSWPLGKVGVPVAISPMAAVDGVIGMVVGVAVGLLLAAAVPAGLSRSADRRGVVAVGALIGLFLGWQAAVSCGVIAAGLALLNAVVTRLTRSGLPITALLAASVLTQVPLWRALDATEWWPGSAGWDVLRRVGWPDAAFAVTSLAATAVTAGVVAWIAGRVAVGWTSPAPAEPVAQEEVIVP